MLVEGPDDKHAILNLFGAVGQAVQYRIDAPGGYQNLRASIPGYLKASDLRCLAIVADADADPAARWQSLRDALARERYVIPAGPLEDSGLVLSGEDDGPAVGVWLMPNNTSAGMLEDFAAMLIAEGDPLLPRAQGAVRGIPADERRFGPTAVAKAELHTWLAWQKEPGVSIGTAIKSRYFDVSRSHAAAFLTWADRLTAAGDERAV